MSATETMKIALFQRNGAVEATAISRLLSAAGYVCTIYRSEHFLTDALGERTCDLLIADVPGGKYAEQDWLPEVMSLAAQAVPVLLLTQAADLEITMRLLAAGANDFLIRPIREAELLTRVQVLLRRAWPERVLSDQLRQGAYVFDPHAGRVTVSGQPVELTRKEFALALLLFQHVGQPLSRTTILDAVWHGEQDTTFRSIDTHISRVRNKLGLRPANGFRLTPVYGYGYLLEQLVG